jgi:CDP-diacylglycerol--glycerol-3-phosphate 3-phosphatidyltransferase
MKHLPNSLTIARILLTPVFLVLILMGTFVGQVLALAVFVVAAVSDYLDGMIARRFDADTDIGRYLDPLADKILVLSAFCVLPFLLPGQVPWWAVGVIALRDIVVTVLRVVAVSSGKHIVTHPLAKIKTAVQLTFLIVVMLLLILEKLPDADMLSDLAATLLDGPFVFLFLMVVVVMTVATGLMYVLAKPQEQASVT